MNRISFLIVIVICFIATSCSSSDDEAKMAADAYAASMTKFDASNLKVGSSDDLMASNLAISSNSLLSEEEKQQARIELWERYCFVSDGGNEDNICFKRDLRGYLYNNDDILKNLIDKSLDRFGNKYIDKEFDKLKASDVYKHAILEGWCSSNDFKNNNVAKVVAVYCLNLNNKVLLDAAKWISVKMSSAQNRDEIIDLKKQYSSKFLTPSGSIVSLKEEKSSKLFIFRYYSHEQLLQLPTYYGIMNGLLGEIFEVATSKHQ